MVYLYCYCCSYCCSLLCLIPILFVVVLILRHHCQAINQLIVMLDWQNRSKSDQNPVKPNDAFCCCVCAELRHATPACTIPPSQRSRTGKGATNALCACECKCIGFEAPIPAVQDDRGESRCHAPNFSLFPSQFLASSLPT